MGELFNFSDTSWLTSTDGQHKLLFDLTNNRLDLQEVGDIRCLTGATPTERLRITAAGNVGIGTATPGFQLDIAGVINARDIYKNGAPLATSQWGNVIGGITYTAGSVGIGTVAPDSPLTIGGGRWDVANSEGDLKIGNSTYRFKIGVALGGGGAGDRRGPAHGGTDHLMLGSGTTDTVILQNDRVGIGTLTPANQLDVAGDIAILGKHALRGSDPWLRLNQDGAFTAGVHTPSVFAPGSLNVGGAGNWGNPGWGNAWIAGSVGIGITAPRTPLHVLGRISTGADFTSAGAITFYPPDGFAWFHIDNGPAGGRPLGRLRFSYGGNPGDFEVMSMLQNGNVGVGTASPGENLTVAGSVRLGAGGAPVFIGGNQNGPFMQLHDDLWFSDPQNGTIQIRNGNNSNWGTLVGWFSQPSSIEYKKDTTPLREPDLALLLDDALKTDVVRFRYKGDDETSRLRLGAIAEDCPAYLAGADGKSLSTTEYITMLHGAVKVLARRLAALEQRRSIQEVRV